MPSRGYRKGVSDNRQPVPCSIRTHITAAEKRRLASDAKTRSLTLSKLLRALVRGHLNNQRAELPHPNSTNGNALRELTRIGNNLNQLARQANTGMVPLGEAELKRVLAAVLATLQRL